jgi:hypothetical protein
MTANHLNTQLATRYLDILQDAPLASVYPEANVLSGLFLPSVGEHYLSAQKKVLIVGKETRSWRNRTCTIKAGRVASIEAVTIAMDRHQNFLKSPPGASKFMQFYKAASIALAGGSQYLPSTAVWSNLFCVSASSKSPVKADSFSHISELSAKLLKAQIEILQPDAIIFTTGAGYDKHLKSFFPVRTDSHVVEPKALWGFKVDGVQCYRTSHPQWASGQTWREEALRRVIDSTQ